MKIDFSKKWVLLFALVFFLQSCAFLAKEADMLNTETALCDLVLRGFAKKSPFVDIYKKCLFGCNKIENPDLTMGPSNIYSDSQCKNSLPFNGETMLEFCKNEVVLSDTSRNFIGNPNAWVNIDEGKTPLQTTWTLSQAARIDLDSYDQTKKHRPFLKRVKYKEVDGCSLGMWVFKKDTTAKNLKPFVFIHGGSWSLRGTAASLGVGMTAPNLTEMGYIVFSPFYRLLGSADGPAECQKFHGKDIIEDIESAVDWVLENGEQFGMKSFSEEPAKVAIGGQSAGSHLAAYMATHHPEKIDRAFLLYPPTDFSFFVKNASTNCGSNCLYSCSFSGVRSPLADFCDVESFSDLTPTNSCIMESSFPEIIQKNGPANYPPMFIIQGSADSAVPIELNIRLCQALAGEKPMLNQLYNGCELARACGQKSQIRVVAGAEHMLDLRCLDMKYIKGIPCTPGSPAGQEKVSQYLQEAYDTFLSFEQD